VAGYERDAGQRELGTAPLWIERCQHENAALLALQDLSSAARRWVVKVGQWDIATHVTDANHGSVRGVALDLALELFAETVLGDE